MSYTLSCMKHGRGAGGQEWKLHVCTASSLLKGCSPRGLGRPEAKKGWGWGSVYLLINLGN